MTAPNRNHNVIISENGTPEWPQVTSFYDVAVHTEKRLSVPHLGSISYSGRRPFPIELMLLFQRNFIT